MLDQNSTDYIAYPSSVDWDGLFVVYGAFLMLAVGFYVFKIIKKIIVVG